MSEDVAKMVVWPRETVEDGNGTTVYRYVIIGIFASDKPIEKFNGVNEAVIEGHSAGMRYIIENLPDRKPNIRLGNAGQVMTNLDII